MEVKVSEKPQEKFDLPKCLSIVNGHKPIDYVSVHSKNFGK